MLPPNPLTVAFLDSGQGDCTLLISPKGRLMLVDCGSIKNSAVVLPQILEVMRRHLPAAGNVFDTVILTHPDQDHYNLLAQVLIQTGAGVTNVWYGGDRELYRNQLDKNQVYNWLVTRNASPFANSLYGGNAAPLDFDGAQVYLLAANASGDRTAEDGWRVNTNSIVLLVYYYGWKLFLMGDGTSDTEAFIYNSVAAQGPAQILTNQHATTLKMGHHGSTTSSSQGWLQALRPQGLVISADTRVFNGTGMPKASQLDQVVAWSGNVAGSFPNHGVVQFDDTLASPRFDVRAWTQAVASTLHAITWNATYTAYEAAGMSWYWYAGSDGSIDVANTG
jgi:beta-lactamase superfamily II metal-dependent hydrolase